MTEAWEPAGRDGTAHTRRAPGTPCWVSLMVRGTAAIQDFYGELFGWDFRPGPDRPGPYVRALLDGREVAGIGQLPPDRHLPAAWTPYFASDDVDTTAEAVRHRGGTVGVGPLDAGPAGRMALAVDPTGAVFGIRQAMAGTDTGITGGPGTPVWNELLTYDATAAGKFYRTVFGHEEEPADSAALDHVTLRVRGRPVAAVHGLGRALPRDRGPHWLTYFRVADVDGATTRVTELGGHVLRPPGESPRGRAATVTDPEGARFALLQRPR